MNEAELTLMITKLPGPSGMVRQVIDRDREQLVEEFRKMNAFFCHHCKGSERIFLSAFIPNFIAQQLAGVDRGMLFVVVHMVCKKCLTDFLPSIEENLTVWMLERLKPVQLPPQNNVIPFTRPQAIH